MTIIIAVVDHHTLEARGTVFPVRHSARGIVPRVNDAAVRRRLAVARFDSPKQGEGI